MVSKNNWVCAVLDFFGSVREILQVTVSLDHPVAFSTLKRKNSLHLRHIGYQNTKTSQYKVSKNHWVCAVFDFFGSVREILQVTVSFDHPVLFEIIKSHHGDCRGAVISKIQSPDGQCVTREAKLSLHEAPHYELEPLENIHRK